MKNIAQQRITQSKSKHKKNNSQSIWFFLCLSISLHIPFFILSYMQQNSKKQAQQELSLIFVEEYSRKQIVSQNDFNHIPPKKKTNFISKKDKTVDKETRAMLSGLFYQANWEESKSLNSSKTNKPLNRKINSLADPLVKKIESPLRLGISAPNPNNEASPTNTAFSRTMDFLPNIDIGSNTLLNTAAFKYYSYFSRMKKQLYVRWIQYFEQKPIHLFIQFNNLSRNHQLFSTHLDAILSPDGELQDLKVSKSSGKEYVDDAALYAFLSAEPFPNTPTNLVAADGLVHIHQKFHLYIYGIARTSSSPVRETSRYQSNFY